MPKPIRYSLVSMLGVGLVATWQAFNVGVESGAEQAFQENSTSAAEPDFVGHWEGSIAGVITLVFHITESDGTYYSTLDVPQQDLAGRVMDSTTIDGTKLRITFDLIGGVFAGEMLDDGTIAGTWRQAHGGDPFALNLRQRGSESLAPAEAPGRVPG
ncbi:MAG: hypothetical protein GKS06_11380 [Acidobacteria bacterium]|nr:hypothetical protein [Acidobacteriota bacterium]